MAASRVSQVTLGVKNPLANAGDLRDIGSTPGAGRPPGGGCGHPLQNLPGKSTEEPGGLQSTGSQSTGHDWVTEHAHMTASRTCPAWVGEGGGGWAAKGAGIHCFPREADHLLEDARFAATNLGWKAKMFHRN